MAQWLGRLTLNSEFEVLIPARTLCCVELCCVLRKETLLRFPLSTEVYKWVSDPVKDWGR